MKLRTRAAWVTFAFALGVVVLRTSFAAAAPSIDGDWIGWIYLEEGGDLPIRFHFRFVDGAFHGTMDSPAARAHDLELETVEQNENDVHLVRVTSSGQRHVFDARFGEGDGPSPDADLLEGTVDWAGTAGTFQIHRSPLPLPYVDPASYAEAAGAYRLSGSRTLVFSPRFWGEITVTDLGSGRRATLLPLDDSSFFLGSAMYVPSPIFARVRLVRDDDGHVTHIIWQEEGQSATRAAKIPLRDEEVSFTSAGDTLAGTLILPDEPGPHPAIVVIGGSGWTVRGSTRNDGDLFASLGLAALVYDKRGSGGSGGEAVVPFQQTADDAIAAVQYLKTRDDIRQDRVGLSGRSRGGWIAPLAASRSTDVDFLVLFVAPAVSPASQETTRRLNLLRDEGFSDAAVRDARHLLNALWRAAHEGEPTAEYREQYARCADASWLELVDAPDPASQEDADDWKWMRLNMGYNPIPALENVRCPLIALFGGADRNVVSTDNVPRMQKALTAAGNDQFRIVVLANADHGLRDAASADLPLHRRVGYARGAWHSVATWLAELNRK